RRLINRAMLGWGIVQGFPIRLGDEGVVIGRGVALDGCGRELVACEDVVIAGSDDVLWLVSGECGMEAGKPPSAKQEEAPDQKKQQSGENQPGAEEQQEDC